MDDLIARLYSVDGATDCPSGVDEAASNPLTNPPTRVSRKPKAEPIVEFLHGPNQSEISFLDEVQEA